MIDVKTHPSDSAISLARALHAIPSVQGVWWSHDHAGEHLWVRIRSWADADFAPILGAQDQTDPDLTVDVRVFSAEDRTEDGTPLEAPREATAL